MTFQICLDFLDNINAMDDFGNAYSVNMDNNSAKYNNSNNNNQSSYEKLGVITDFMSHGAVDITESIYAVKTSFNLVSQGMLEGVLLPITAVRLIQKIDNSYSKEQLKKANAENYKAMENNVLSAIKMLMDSMFFVENNIMIDKLCTIYCGCNFDKNLDKIILDKIHNIKRGDAINFYERFLTNYKNIEFMTDAFGKALTDINSANEKFSIPISILTITTYLSVLNPDDAKQIASFQTLLGNYIEKFKEELAKQPKLSPFLETSLRSLSIICIFVTLNRQLRIEKSKSNQEKIRFALLVLGITATVASLISTAGLSGFVVPWVVVGGKVMSSTTSTVSTVSSVYQTGLNKSSKQPDPLDAALNADLNQVWGITKQLLTSKEEQYNKLKNEVHAFLAQIDSTVRSTIGDMQKDNQVVNFSAKELQIIKRDEEFNKLFDETIKQYPSNIVKVYDIMKDYIEFKQTKKLSPSFFLAEDTVFMKYIGFRLSCLNNKLSIDDTIKKHELYEQKINEFNQIKNAIITEMQAVNVKEKIILNQSHDSPVLQINKLQNIQELMDGTKNNLEKIIKSKEISLKQIDDQLEKIQPEKSETNVALLTN